MSNSMCRMKCMYCNNMVHIIPISRIPEEGSEVEVDKDLFSTGNVMATDMKDYSSLKVMCGVCIRYNPKVFEFLERSESFRSASKFAMVASAAAVTSSVVSYSNGSIGNAVLAAGTAVIQGMNVYISSKRSDRYLRVYKDCVERV